MGLQYALLNKTRNESIRIDGIGQKYYELMAPRYGNFVVYMLLEDWKNDHVIFVGDKDMVDYGEEFDAATDVSEKYWEEFLEFVDESKWYFEDKYNKKSKEEVDKFLKDSKRRVKESSKRAKAASDSFDKNIEELHRSMQ